MRIVIQHEKYGEIVYEENFWTGKKSITVGGVPLLKEYKNCYAYQCGEQSVHVTVKGSAYFGASLLIGGDMVTITPKPAWYEFLAVALGFGTVMAWGNNVALCSIVPIVGGAIGGAVCGFMAPLTIGLLRSVRGIGKKIALALGMALAAFAINFLLALALLSA